MVDKPDRRHVDGMRHEVVQLVKEQELKVLRHNTVKLKVEAK